MDLALENFIPAYPDQDDPFIQWTVSTLREFNSLASSPTEPIPAPGKFFHHQDLFSRLLRTWDKCLLIHETGTGKTCTMVSLSEYYLNNPGQINQIYVLEKGDTTKKDFKNQIKTKCTFRKYATNKDVNRYYKIMTYGKFVTDEIGTLNDEQLLNKFSGCIFFVDEAHNVRNFSKKKTEMGYEYEYDDDNYDKIKHLFRLVKRCKIVISTATPMINTPKEVGKLIDLLNEKDIPEDFDWVEADIDTLEPYFRGKVSYVRTLDTGIKINNRLLGKKESDGLSKGLCPIKDESEEDLVGLDVYHLKMKPGGIQDITHQAVMYENKNVWRAPILASSYVPPPPIATFDNVGGNSDMIKQLDGNENYAWNNEKYNNLTHPEFDGLMTISQYMSNLELVQECSVKFAFLIRMEINYRMNNPNGLVSSKRIEKWKDQGFVPFGEEGDTNPRFLSYRQPGNAFAYIELVDKGGAIHLGLTLQLYGFKKFTHKGNVVDANGRLTIEKGLRYGLMIHKSTEETELLNKVFNHPDNCNGDYVQLIIGSEIARDGINLYNVTRGYLFTPDWHVAGMYQAMSRFIRSVSHNDLIRQKLEKGDTSRVEVNVFKLSAVNSQGYSTDDCIYARARDKDFVNRRVLNFLKRVAVDSMIHYNRNVRANDKVGSQQCDYLPCKFECLSPKPPRGDLGEYPDGMALGQGPTPEDYDYRNYNILYESERRDAIKEKLIESINKNGSVTFDALIEDIMESGSPEKVGIVTTHVYDAVYSMIEDKILFRNRYGAENYLASDGINIYAEQEYLNGTHIYSETGYYSNLIVGMKNMSLDVLVANAQPQLEELETSLESVDVTNPVELAKVFTDTIKDFSKRRDILEEALITYFTKSDELKPYQKVLVDYYNLLWYELPRQDKNIKAVDVFLNTQRQGAKAKSDRNRDIKNTIIWDQDMNNPKKVICHIYKEPPKTGYTKNILFRSTQYEVRLLDLSQKPYQFRDLTDTETHIYPHLIEEALENKTAYSRRDGVFGYTYDNDPGVISFATQEEMEDTRQQKRGRVCTNYSAAEISRYLLYLDAKHIQCCKEATAEEDTKSELKDKLEFIFEKMDQEHDRQSETFKAYLERPRWIKKVYALLKQKLKKGNMCRLLHDSYVAANKVINFPYM